MNSLHVVSTSCCFSLSLFLLCSSLLLDLTWANKEHLDYEEEESSGQVPRFLMRDEEISIHQGGDVRFTCEVDKLGVYDIMFKEGPNSNTIISLGNKVFKPEYTDRVELVQLSEDKGMTLVLKNVTKEDTGKYACSLNHPAQNNTVIFNLKVGDKPSSSSSLESPSTGGTNPNAASTVLLSLILISSVSTLLLVY